MRTTICELGLSHNKLILPRAHRVCGVSEAAMMFILSIVYAHGAAHRQRLQSGSK
jgi:hypothetical protein